MAVLRRKLHNRPASTRTALRPDRCWLPRCSASLACANNSPRVQRACGLDCPGQRGTSMAKSNTGLASTHSTPDSRRRCRRSPIRRRARSRRPLSVDRLRHRGRHVVALRGRRHSGAGEAADRTGRPGPIAEIGTFEGRFFIAMAHALEPGEKALGIDLFDWPNPEVIDRFEANCLKHGIEPAQKITWKTDSRTMKACRHPGQGRRREAAPVSHRRRAFARRADAGSRSRCRRHARRTA